MLKEDSLANSSKSEFVAQAQASSLFSVFIKGLAFLILCQPDLTAIIQHLPFSHHSLLCAVKDGKEQTQRNRSGLSNTQHCLESAQLTIVSEGAAERCLKLIHLLLPFHGQSRHSDSEYSPSLLEFALHNTWRWARTGREAEFPPKPVRTK